MGVRALCKICWRNAPSRRASVKKHNKSDRRKQTLKAYYQNGGNLVKNLAESRWRKTDKGKALRKKVAERIQREGKFRVYGRLHYALKIGKIKKKPCEVCGINLNVHAHHDDYNKPLDVVWLCSKHHRGRHA